jgi:hypothetical protein
MPVGNRFTGKVAQESKHILGCLLQDFQARGLGADDLRDGYHGLAMAELKKRSIGADNATTAVDFDLALKELEDSELVKTGPMDVRTNDPGSALVFILPYSKREYVYLTTKGYKAAR